jgi:hypothetical protein
VEEIMSVGQSAYLRYSSQFTMLAGAVAATTINSAVSHKQNVINLFLRVVDEIGIGEIKNVPGVATRLGSLFAKFQEKCQTQSEVMLAIAKSQLTNILPPSQNQNDAQAIGNFGVFQQRQTQIKVPTKTAPAIFIDSQESAATENQTDSGSAAPISSK